MKGGERKDSQILAVILLSGFFSVWAYNVSKWVRTNSLAVNIKKPPSARSVLILVLEIIKLAEHLDLVDNFIKFHGFLKVNRPRVEEDEIEEIWDDLMRDDQGVKLASRKEQEKMKYYEILVYIVKIGINKYPKSNSLWLLLSHLEHSYMQSKWNSVYSMQHLLGRKPSPRQILSITRTSLQIERQLGASTLRDIEIEGLDLPKIITVQHELHQFIKMIEKVVRSQLEFWKEAKEEKPSSRKLLSLGSYSHQMSKKIYKQYLLIVSIDKLSLETLTMYGNFLSCILNHEKKAKEIQSLIPECKREIGLRLNQFNATMNECIILVSGNKCNFAEVLKADKQVISLFGYKPKELVGENVRILLPEHIGKIHNDLMKGYFINDKKTVMDKVRIVFGRRRDGTLIPLNLRLKVLPSIMEGIRLIGLLSSTDISMGEGMGGLSNIEGLGKPSFIVFDNLSSDIIGVSASCEKVIGLKPEFYEAQDAFSLDMDKICPELFSKKNQKLFGKQQLSLTIDMSGMLENHELRQDLDESYNAVKARGRWKKQVDTHKKIEEDFNQDSESQLSYRQLHPGHGGSSLGDIESSYDEESEELKKRFRCFQADAWVCRFEDNTDYDLCCLLFYLEEQSVAYLSQRNETIDFGREQEKMYETFRVKQMTSHNWEINSEIQTIVRPIRNLVLILVGWRGKPREQQRECDS